MTSRFDARTIEACIDSVRREWYRVNDEPVKDGESLIDIGLRVGYKTALIKVIVQLNQLNGQKYDDQTS